MDSYMSYKDVPARSPDRNRSVKEDSRGREPRIDSFYRGRSPGNPRERRRSRSPSGVDRYEPRARGREEYSLREREDRPRRIGSQPANIDRYVPGQDAATPTMLVNPLQDPAILPFQVGFSYYGEWWRVNDKIKEETDRIRTGKRRESDRVRAAWEVQEDRENEKAKIQAAYDTYKTEVQAKLARAFVMEHKKEQWFKERYDPETKNRFRLQLNEFRRGVYSQWEQDLESGTFDDYTLEGLLKSDINGAGLLLEKEEGEATASNEILGVDDLIRVQGSDIRDDDLFQPTLLIKTIAPHVSRQNLESFCREHLGEEEGGFKWLSLSDPNPTKRYHRMGWVMLHPASDVANAVYPSETRDDENGDEPNFPAAMSTAERALEAINGKTVKDELRGDFVCHVGVHNPPASPRRKALWDLFSAPERIEKDLGFVQRLVNKFEENFGSDFNASLKILEKVEDLKAAGRLSVTSPLSPVKKRQKRELNLDIDGDIDFDDEEGAVVDEGEDMDDEDLVVKKKQLDLLIEYLRRVFHFCFFCVFESDSVHELSRKCSGGHLRRPRSTLSSAGKAVARASANGEPFPGLKKVEPNEEGEIDSGEGEKKSRGSMSKPEQQLLRAYNWVKNFEEKINLILQPESADLRKLGGRPAEEWLNDEFAKYVKQEDEFKWRCKLSDCTKLFKEEHFWRKHVEKRHTEWLEGLKQEFDLINAYILDPSHIVPQRADSNSNGHFTPQNGMNASGTPRGFNLQNFSLNTMMASMPSFQIPGQPFPSMFGNAPSVSTAGWTPSGDDRNGGIKGIGNMGSVGNMRSMGVLGGLGGMGSLGTVGGSGGVGFGGGPIRRGGALGGHGQYRSGPYDRRPGGRWDGGTSGFNRSRMGAAGRWGDGAAGLAAVGPREAVLGRSLKSYEDLDQVTSGGGSELNY